MCQAVEELDASIGHVIDFVEWNGNFIRYVFRRVGAHGHHVEDGIRGQS